MRVALIADESRMLHEQAAVNRTVIGLIGEGVHVTRITSDADEGLERDPTEQRLALAQRLTAPMRVLPWSRRQRCAQVIEYLERPGPDVLMACGPRAWDLAIDLAGPLERPVAIEIWSADEIAHLPRGRRAERIAAYLAPTRPLARALRRAVEPHLVTVVPPGVDVPSAPRSVLDGAAESITIAVIGAVRDVAAYRGVLGGLGRIAREFPQMQAFLELHGRHEQEIWRACRRLDLLEHLSTIGNAALERNLLSRCDVLVLPERYGEVRSLLYESMAGGLPVVASEDPFLDVLENGVTAVIVEQADAESWARGLRRVLSDPDEARRLGAAGRARMQSGHRTGHRVRRLLDTFEQMMSGGAVPIARGHDADDPPAE